MDILSQIQNVDKVYLDTNCYIYFLEQNPNFYSLVLPIFEAAMNGHYQIVTSELTLAELLVRPYQLERLDIVATYREFLTDVDLMVLCPISLNILDHAASIRAEYKTALPDAVHIATALDTQCDVFVTNDRKMKGIHQLRPVYLGL